MQNSKSLHTSMNDIILQKRILRVAQCLQAIHQLGVYGLELYNKPVYFLPHNIPFQSIFSPIKSKIPLLKSNLSTGSDKSSWRCWDIVSSYAATGPTAAA